MATDHTEGRADEPFLIAVRRAVAARDAVPTRVVEAAYAAFSWRTVDAELAELLYDSAVAEPAGARSDQATVRAMTFSSEQATFEVEINEDEILGQLVPALPGEVVVVIENVAGQRVEVDTEDGRFRIVGLPQQPFRLRFEGTDGANLATGLITP